MIPFECPHCGLKTQVAPRYAGRTGPCAGCGRTIAIPGVDVSQEKRSTGSTPRRPPQWVKPVAGLLAVVSIMVLSAFLLTQLMRPALQQARLAARQTYCRSQVERILQAILTYRDEHGSFPPAYSADEQQRPLHSWRVLILPYLGPEARSIYSQLRLDQPWDSPENVRFAQLVPAVFVCPEDKPFSAGDTSYCAVVGRNCLIRFDAGRTLADVNDELATVVVVVEAHNSGINWMQPRDITETELALGVNSGVQGSCGSRHSGGVAFIGTADGKVHLVSDTVQPDVLIEMATVSGGEVPSVLFHD